MSHVQRNARFWLLLVVVAVLATAASCSTGKPAPAGIKQRKVRADSSGNVVYLRPVPTEARSVISKNYTLGGRRTASVGESMVGVRNYTAAERVTAATVLRDFRQLCEVPKPPTAKARAKAKAAGPLRARGASRRAAAAQGDDEGATVGEAVAAAEASAGSASDSVPPGAGSAVRGGDAVEQAQKEAHSELGILDSLERFACRAGILGRMRAKKGDVLNVPGAFEQDGELYYLLEIATGEGSVFLAVDRRGRVKPDRYAVRRKSEHTDVVTPLGIPLTYLKTRGPLEIHREPGEVEDPYDVPSTGPTHRGPIVRFETSQTVLPQGTASQHFELVYSGTSYDHRGMVYHVLYREYRRDNPQLPMYTKSLAYSASQSTIDLLGLSIRVHDVNETTITYTVQRD